MNEHFPFFKKKNFFIAAPDSGGKNVPPKKGNKGKEVRTVIIIRLLTNNPIQKLFRLLSRPANQLHQLPIHDLELAGRSMAPEHRLTSCIQWL